MRNTKKRAPKQATIDMLEKIRVEMRGELAMLAARTVELPSTVEEWATIASAIRRLGRLAREGAARS